MSDQVESVSGTNMDQIKIAMNALYLCVDFAMKHIAKHEGMDAAAEFKAKLLTALQNGDIDMALLEETRTFDLIVSKIEALDPAPGQ